MTDPGDVRDPEVDSCLVVLERVAGTSADLREENERLRAQVADLRMEVEHLRRMRPAGSGIRMASEILAEGSRQ